jgi:hypothetical protein
MRQLLFVLFIVIGASANAQSAKEMLKEIDGKWQRDGNGDVLFTRTIDLPGQSQSEIFNRVIEYYRSHYGNARSISQTTDPATGTITRKGVYKDSHTGYTVLKAIVDAWFVMTVTATDGKAEMRLVLTEYEEEILGYGEGKAFQDGPKNIYNMKVRETYPVNPNGAQKTIMTKAFYKSYKATMESMDALERGLKQ